LNSKLHPICDSQGRPGTLFLTAGQVSDYTGAAALPGTMPAARVLLADRGYDADRLRDALADRKIEAVFGGFDPPDQILFP
jgi:transposase